jgi:hypothetical protein
VPPPLIPVPALPGALGAFLGALLGGLAIAAARRRQPARIPWARGRARE